MLRKFARLPRLFRKLDKTSSYLIKSRLCATESNDETFRAALLYPERENLKIDTLANKAKLDKGFVNFESHFLIIFIRNYQNFLADTSWNRLLQH